MSVTNRQWALPQNGETGADSRLLPSGDSSEYRGYDLQTQDEWQTIGDSSTTREVAELSVSRPVSFPWEASLSRIGLQETSSAGSEKDPSSPQRPKVIISSSLKPTIKQILLFQFPALAFTSALLVLYAKNIHFNPTADQLGALLVAAKVHETLIVASSFHILYYHIRRGLLGRSGIPFGFLTAPFQLTSPFYLLTSEFWSGVRCGTSQSTLLASLVIVTFLLSALAGASSGIIFLPKLGWHTLSQDGAVKLTNRGLAGYALSSSIALFPSIVDISTASASCLHPEKDLAEMPYCPFTGLVQARWDTFLNFGVIHYWGSVYGANLSISSSDKRSINFWLNTTTPGISAATVPLSSVASIFSLTNGDSRFGATQDALQYTANQHGVTKLTAELHTGGEARAMKQPRVITQCSQESQIEGRESGSPHYQFSINQDFYDAFNFAVPASILEQPLRTGERFGFVDVNDYLPRTVRASTAIWIQKPYVHSQYDSVILCLVDARWLEADAWTITSNTGLTISHSLHIR